MLASAWLMCWRRSFIKTTDLKSARERFHGFKPCVSISGDCYVMSVCARCYLEADSE